MIPGTTLRRVFPEREGPHENSGAVGGVPKGAYQMRIPGGPQRRSEDSRQTRASQTTWPRHKVH